MRLSTVPLSLKQCPIPADVQEYLTEASRRIDEFVSANPVLYRGFLPSNYVMAYQALQYVRTHHLATGDRLCEWGSGFGVVATLGALCGFESYGVESQDELVRASQQLAEDFSMNVRFVAGSFIPGDANQLIDQAFADQEGELGIDLNMESAYQTLGLGVEDFDVIFCYPWPNDVALTRKLFGRFASTNALLMTYRSEGQIRLERKCG